MTTTIRADKVLINAPLEKVWHALIDVENYPRWNPFTTRVETTFVVGEPAILYVTMNGQHQRVQHEVIITFEPPHTLAWGIDHRCTVHPQKPIAGRSSKRSMTNTRSMKLSKPSTACSCRLSWPCIAKTSSAASRPSERRLKKYVEADRVIPQSLTIKQMIFVI